MTLAEIQNALEIKYAPPSWAFFSEVKAAVGFGVRRADGIAIAMWRSLGLEILGFEIKRSRSDWLREIKNGGKSEEIFQYCDRWWIVVDNPEIVRSEELPSTWGLQHATPRGLRTIVAAPKLKPKPAGIEFVAEVLRRQFNSDRRPEALIKEYERGFANGERRIQTESEYKITRLQDENARLQRSLAEFEKISGIRIDGWNGGIVGAQLRAMRELDLDRLRRFAISVQQAAKEIAAATESFAEGDTRGRPSI